MIVMCTASTHSLRSYTSYSYSFWCAEQAFEQYAPGVIEAVSGYSGPNGIDNPTYRNHPGHYEVILIEYDPLKTTYKLLVEYAWRNIDPFNGAGQFCDYGSSYYPAIFYDGDEERMAAEEVKEEILQQYPTWDEDSLVVPFIGTTTKVLDGRGLSSRLLY